MRFLSGADLLSIAQRTAHPSPVHVRSQTGFRAVLTVPPDDEFEASGESKHNVFKRAALFAALLVRMNPFSDFNLEIAARGTERLLAVNGYELRVDNGDFLDQLARLSIGTRQPEQLTEWLIQRSVKEENMRPAGDALLGDNHQTKS